MEKCVWKNNLEMYLWLYLENVIVEAPDFQAYWDIAFEGWKDYIIKKE